MLSIGAPLTASTCDMRPALPGSSIAGVAAAEAACHEAGSTAPLPDVESWRHTGQFGITLRKYASKTTRKSPTYSICFS
ncbi:MAG TPA: hypothetical protein VN716_25725 [Vicinamibacterales bacterium]|nr:hypothetical protein [Vicinamibacterales bacterium]